MSNQTCGVSARISFPAFHVCSVVFHPPKSAKLDWYACSQEESSMPYLSDRPTVCKLLALQDWGLVCGRYSGYYTTVDFACYGLPLLWGFRREWLVMSGVPFFLCTPNKSFTIAKDALTEFCQWYYTEQITKWFTLCIGRFKHMHTHKKIHTETHMLVFFCVLTTLVHLMHSLKPYHHLNHLQPLTYTYG